MAKKLNRRKKLFSIALALLILLLLGGSIYLFTRPNKSNATIPSTSPQNTTAPSVTNKQQSDLGGKSDGSGSAKTSGSGISSSTVLFAPSGTFVSNHHPNISGSPTPSSEQSVCNTTPGASCYIKFTSSSVTKTLSPQTVDINGSAYWNWDVNSAGLTPGTWQILAIASLNGQTKSTVDTLSLVVQP